MAVTLRNHAKVYADLVQIEINHNASRQSDNQSDLLQSLSKLRDAFLQISGTKHISWSDNKNASGVSRLLREQFPVPGFGKPSPPLPVEISHHYHASRQSEQFPVPGFGVPATTPRQVGERYQSAFIDAHYSGRTAEAMVLRNLVDFCRGLGEVLHRIERSKSDHAVGGGGGFGQQGLPDYTYTFRRDQAVPIKKLCQFCWRPAGNGRGETCCARHSQHKNPAGYARAKRQGMQTPVLLEIAFNHGTARSMQGSDGYEVVQGLRAMKENWRAAVEGGDVQEFINALDGKTYKKIAAAENHKDWDHFFSALCDAFEVGASDMPDDPDWIAIVLPYAIEEVEQAKERKKTKRAPVGKDKVLALAKDLSGTGRGWQTRLAKQTGVSRQRVSEILKAAQFAA